MDDSARLEINGRVWTGWSATVLAALIGCTPFVIGFIAGVLVATR